jgi:hypothetical protein
MFRKREQNDVFKQKNRMSELNKNNSDIHYENNDNCTLIKTFLNRRLFDIELYMTIILNEVKIDIIPEILKIKENIIYYDISDCKSLNEILKTNVNKNLLFKELLLFIQKIQNYKLNVNLNINNIFVKIDKNKQIKFFLINVSNANFNTTLKSNTDFIFPLYTRLNYHQIKSNNTTVFFENELNENELNELNENELDELNENELDELNENEFDELNENEFDELNELNELNENELTENKEIPNDIEPENEFIDMYLI